MKFIFFLIIFVSLNVANRVELNAIPQNTKNQQNYKSLLVTRRSNRNNFVGSNLFDGSRKKCFSIEDVNILLARRIFERLIPQKLPPGLLDDKCVRIILRYFSYGDMLIKRMPNSSATHIMKRAYYDTVGGFFQCHLLPVIRFSYYAGKLCSDSVFMAMQYFEKCRVYLNTHGNGWCTPKLDAPSQLKGVKIKPLNRESEVMGSCCSFLDLATSTNSAGIVDESLIVALPKIDFEDNNRELSNIWIPFSRKRIYNLKSSETSDVLAQYYTLVTGCYKEKKLNQEHFNEEFKKWLDENIEPHLNGNQFYPGLEGILNIYIALKNPYIEEKLKDKRYENFSAKNASGRIVTIKRNSEDELNKHWFNKIFLTEKEANSRKKSKTSQDVKIRQIMFLIVLFLMYHLCCCFASVNDCYKSVRKFLWKAIKNFFKFLCTCGLRRRNKSSQPPNQTDSKYKTRETQLYLENEKKDKNCKKADDSLRNISSNAFNYRYLRIHGGSSYAGDSTSPTGTGLCLDK